MQRVFLSYSFRDADREPARWVRTVLESHGIRAITGEALGGGGLTATVKARIDQSDAFVGIWTRREAIDEAGTKFRTSNWLIEEANYARHSKKPTVLLVEEGVDASGMWEAHERLAFSRDRPLEAILRFGQTLGVWRDEHGRIVEVRLTPDDIARKAAQPGSGYECHYRLHRGHEVGEWTRANVRSHSGGVLTHLFGVTDDQLFEIWLKSPNDSWMAPASASYVAMLEKVES